MDSLKNRSCTTTGMGLILSVLFVAVVAYRNDLSSTRHGCVWSTIERETSSSSNPPQGPGGGGGFSLDCNLRTLSVDFWNYTFNREQIERTRGVKIKCSDKLFFESLLSPNQTFVSTLVNLKEVQIEACKIRKIPARVWASLAKLKTLVIRTQNAEWKSSALVGLEVETGAFEGLGQSLEILDLSQNGIWTLSSDDLCSLKSLIHLNISHNNLSDLEELVSAPGGRGKSYCELSIQNVDLSHNLLRRLGRGVFPKMKRVTEIRLQNNLIAEVDDTTLEGLGQLKVLNLSSNRLVALPPFIFNSNVNLRELYLQNNSISALSAQVFSKLDQLLLLDLSKNSLTSQWVKDNMFSSLSRLIVLRLSNNQLSYVDENIFKDLTSLQALYLNGNKIESVSPEAFQSLRNLHVLDLSNNKLSYVDEKMFSNLFVLRQLYLDHNKIREMDESSLKNCSSLQDLGLVQNSLQEVPVALQSLSELKTLDLGENRITRVSNSSFLGLRSIVGLRLVGNGLQSLQDGFCSVMRKLSVLNLSQNRIEKISPSAFSGCPEVRVLRLDANSLTGLPPTIATQLPNILWFNISENQLQWMDIRQMPGRTEWLDLSYNNIESINGPPAIPIPPNNTATIISGTRPKQVMNTLPNLRILDLSHNKLKHLDNSLIPPSLETLRVNYNELLTVAPKTFIFFTQIRRVELVGNQIETLNLQSLQIPPIPSGRELPEFFLRQNPYMCSCEMEWLSRLNQLTLSRQQPRIVDLDGMFCRTAFSRSIGAGSNGSPSSSPLLLHPQQQYDVIPLSEAKPKDFLCPYKSHCFALCHCCEFDACDCQMTCPDGCSCHHDNSWSTNIVDCSNSNFSQVPPRLPMDSTEIHLDGNTIFQLGSHIFIGKKNLRVLYLNDSHVEVIKNKTFNGLRALEVLHLEENLLTELYGYEFQDIENLRELYLQNNIIRYIAPETFANLKFLQILRIDGNQLIDFNVWELGRNGYLNSVMLSNNPWTCDCAFLTHFRTWVASKTAIVVDFGLARCQGMVDYGTSSFDGIIEAQSASSQPTIASMCNSASDVDITHFNNYEGMGNTEMEINNRISSMGGAEEVAGPPYGRSPSENQHHLTQADNTFWALILCLTALLIVVLVILAIFRQEIYYWGRSALFHHHHGEGGSFCSNLLCCCCLRKYSGSHRPNKVSCPSSGGGDDLEKLFDAYFLYSKRDEDMLVQKVIPELEDPHPTGETPPGHKFRLCLHNRDLSLSPDSPFSRELVLSACDASKRVIIVLSQRFLENEWSSSSHFRTSVQSAIGLHQKKLIFILLPDFDQSSVSSLSSELSNSVIKNRCLHWTDKNFWTKFKRLLPPPTTSISIPCPHEGGGGMMTLNLQNGRCVEDSQFPYTLIMNPNLHQLQQLQASSSDTHHYHHNIIPYQIPLRNNNSSSSSLPPVPKHQIVLPAPGGLGMRPPPPPPHLNGSLHHHHHPNHHPIITNNLSLIHPIPAQLELTPQQYGYSNETFHLQQGNHRNHHHNNNHHNHQPIHFSSQNHHPLHSHTHSHSQLSNSNFSNISYPHLLHNQQNQQIHQNQNNQGDQTYSSSAVSSCGELDHVYSTLDSPEEEEDYSPKKNGGNNSKDDNNVISNGSKSIHTAQHSTSSGVSSGSDMTCGESSAAVSPSSPTKNGILNTNGNGKMYFV